MPWWAWVLLGIALFILACCLTAAAETIDEDEARLY
jgi:hypothetical protein